MNDVVEISLEYKDRVALLTLNRPESRNPLGLRFSAQVHSAFDDIEARGGVGALIVSGTGPVFCGGGDIHRVMSTAPQPIHDDYKLIRGFNAVIARLRSVDYPVIAAVNGPAVGGGAALALACDFAIVAETARYDFAFGRLGISGADMGCAYLLSRALGPQRAAHLLLTGGSLDAGQLFAVGLASEVVATSDLGRRALEIAQLVADGASWANQATKLSLRRSLTMDFDAALEYEAFVQTALFASEEHKRRLQLLLNRGRG